MPKLVCEASRLHPLRPGAVHHDLQLKASRADAGTDTTVERGRDGPRIELLSAASCF